jgi:hypothetical protein
MEIEKYSSEEAVTVMLVGNKVDQDKREVPSSEAQNFADNLSKESLGMSNAI